MSDVIPVQSRHLLSLASAFLVILAIWGLGFLYQRQLRLSLPGHLALVAEQKAASRTYERPLPDSEWTTPPLSALASWRTLDGDMISFAAVPSHDPFEYGVVLRLQDGKATAHGALAVTARNAVGAVSTHVETFGVPSDAYRALVARIDPMTDAWPGEGSGTECFDGTGFAFERIRSGRSSSGQATNCEGHYYAMGDLVLRFLRVYAPSSRLPDGEGWQRSDDQQRLSR